MWTMSAFADEIADDFDVQLRTLGELGIRFVELRSAWGVNMLDLDDDQLATVARRLDETGTRVSSIGSPIGKIRVDDDFDEHLRRFDRAVHVATVVNAPYIRIFSFYVPEGQDPRMSRDEVLRRMSALVDRAGGHDVVLLHENEKGIYGNSPQRCLDLVESIGSPQLRVAWDAGNFVQCGFRPHDDGYALLRPHLEYVQIKDVDSTGIPVPAGQGDGQVKETVRALAADGFDGFFSLEPHLHESHRHGGFSGPDRFAVAYEAFQRIVADEGIPLR